jgi:dGTPase
MVRELYDAFTADPSLLPPDYRSPPGDASGQARRVADYIAGMTDRYAIAEHRRIYSLENL